MRKYSKCLQVGCVSTFTYSCSQIHMLVSIMLSVAGRLANFKGYFSLKAADFDYMSQILLLLHTCSLGAEWDCKCVARTLKCNVLQVCHTKENSNSFADNSENVTPETGHKCTCNLQHRVLPSSAGISLLSLGLPENANTDPWVRKRAWFYSEIQTLTSSLLDHAADRCVLLKGSKHPAQDVPFNLPSAFLSCISLMFKGVLCSLWEVLPPVRSNQTCNRLWAA